MMTAFPFFVFTVIASLYSTTVSKDENKFFLSVEALIMDIGFPSWAYSIKKTYHIKYTCTIISTHHKNERKGDPKVSLRFASPLRRLSKRFSTAVRSELVDRKRLELSTSSMPWRRSPN